MGVNTKYYTFQMILLTLWARRRFKKIYDKPPQKKKKAEVGTRDIRPEAQVMEWMGVVRLTWQNLFLPQMRYDNHQMPLTFLRERIISKLDVAPQTPDPPGASSSIPQKVSNP
jgi:hypothetical protein